MTIRIVIIGLLTAGSLLLAQEDLQEKAQEYFGKGLNAYNAGDYAGAISWYTKCIELDSLTMNVRFNRATTYLRMRDLPKAKDDLDFILERQPELLNARMQRAVVQAEMGLSMLALEDLNTVIRQDSTFPKAYLMRGRLKARVLGDDPGACSDLKAALALGDRSALQYMSPACRESK
jgi:tetratricopeptide (TPR) repeat protein